MEKTYIIKLTQEEIEELLHATISSYMEYDERTFEDKVLQEQYNAQVYDYNTRIDDLRLKLKKALENDAE